ncbi:MAG: NFACT RNA binding domain-containing protein [Nitrospiria bacterium]
MALSVRQIGAVLDEIGTSPLGGIIRKIAQPKPGCILFEIDRKGVRKRLLFSAQQQHARCHLVSLKYKISPKPPRFCQLLRKHLLHRCLISIDQVPGDRIVRMRTAWAADAEASERVFVAELMGLQSNFFVLDAKGAVIGSLHPSHRRGLTAGSIYRPPRINLAPSFKETRIPLIGSLNHSIERYYRALEEKEEIEVKKSLLLEEFDQAIRRRRIRLKRLYNGLEAAKDTSVYRRYGEILKAQLHRIKPEMSQWTGGDPVDPDTRKVTIPLKPGLNPSENMTLYFKRYKKGRSTQKTLQNIVEDTEQELARLESDKLMVLKGDLSDIASMILRPSPLKREKAGRAGGPPIYYSLDNMAMVVGRNDLENNRITFEMARGNDLWFHARAAAGAHLVVRMEGKKEIPYQSLLDAATLALHFSQLNANGKGEIIYTYKKYIRKIRRGKAGAVTCAQEKTLYIVLETHRLKRILESSDRIGKSP